MGIFQSLSLLNSFGKRGSKYIGDVDLFGFTVNAVIIGVNPHTAVIDPTKKKKKQNDSKHLYIIRYKDIIFCYMTLSIRHIYDFDNIVVIY